MSAPFVVHALSYCLGKGELARRGQRRRLWLTLQRSEPERTYLDHQLRRLRRLHDGPLEAHWDRLPGEGFYDTERVRLRSEALEPAYECLYPRDRWTLSAEVLQLCGWRGIAALWADGGRWRGKQLWLGGSSLRLQEMDYILLGEALRDLKIKVRADVRRDCLLGLFIEPRDQQTFAAQLEHHLHYSLRPALLTPRS